MKPALSPTMTGFLPIRSASALTSSNTSSAVMTVRTTSTNCWTGAGLKKCIPTTRLGLPVATAISVTGSDEVFVARMASGETTLSTRLSSSRLRSRCSGTASTTSWHPARSSRSVVNATRACRASCSSCVIFPRASARPVEPASTCLPCSTPWSSTSTATTSIPLRANTSTMPAPIVPSPITPTLVKSRAMTAILAEGSRRHEGHRRDAPHLRPLGATKVTHAGCRATRPWAASPLVSGGDELGLDREPLARRQRGQADVGLDPQALAQLEEQLVVGRDDGPEPGGTVRGVALLDPADLGLQAPQLERDEDRWELDRGRPAPVAPRAGAVDGRAQEAR